MEKIRGYQIILFLSIFLPKPRGSESSLTEEGKLYSDILGEYELLARPVLNISHPVIVNLGVTIIKVLEMNEKDGLMTTALWHNVDPRLTWNPADYGNVTDIRLPTNRIWKPDIYLYNGHGQSAVFERWTTDALILNGGNITVVTSGTYTTHCMYSYTNFPIDKQKCDLKYGSWTYDGSQVALEFDRGSPDADLTTYIHHSEWELINAPVRINKVYYECCPEPYFTINVILDFERRGEPILENATASSIFICLTLALSFVIPASSSHKITFGLLHLLNVWWMMWNYSKQYPILVRNSRYGGSPLIGYFQTLQMCCQAGFLANIFTVWLYHRIPPAPSWVRKYILHILTILCLFRHKQRGTNVVLPGKEGKNAGHLSVGDSENCTLNDWQYLACVVDRFFLLLFSIIALIMCLAKFPS